MTSSEFINKFKSKYLWGNLGAMFLVLVLLCVGVKFGIDIYTHHGEAIRVPDIRYKNINDATRILDDAGLEIVVSDTGYVRSLPADCILEQTPAFGEVVKSGHIIYVTINSNHSPRITIPDVIDNSSLREAMAKLTAMGFKLGSPEYIPGEEDWVYGILVKGRHVVAGDKVSIDDVLIIQVGNGQRDTTDSFDMVDPVYHENDDVMEGEGDGTESTEDNFEVVPGDKLPMMQVLGIRATLFDFLEHQACEEDKAKGLDIADYLLKIKPAEAKLQALIKQNPAIRKLIDVLKLEIVDEPQPRFRTPKRQRGFRL